MQENNRDQIDFSYHFISTKWNILKNLITMADRKGNPPDTQEKDVAYNL